MTAQEPLSLQAMMPIPVREGEPTELASPLREAIRVNFEESPDQYDKEIRQLSQLRTACLRVSRDDAGFKRLASYFAQIDFLLARFSTSIKHPLQVTFRWRHAWKQDSLVERPTLLYEKAAVLYNMGAVQANMGRKAWEAGCVGDETSLKQALLSFQKAAECFTAAQRLACSSDDMNEGICDSLKNLMIAQAYECLVCKATGSKKPVTVARLCIKVSEHYEKAASGFFAQFPDGLNAKSELGHPYRNADELCRCKMHLYRAKAFQFQAATFASQDEFGLQVSWLTAALDELKELIADHKAIKSSRVETLLADQLLHDVEKDHEKAKRENDAVFHEKVLPVSQLEPIEPLIIFETSPYEKDPTAQDMFAALLPLKVHLAASEYSEAVDQLLREVTQLVETKDQELDKELEAMALSNLSLHDATIDLPPDIFTKGAALRDEREVTPAALMEQLAEILADAKRLRAAVDKDLNSSATSKQAVKELDELRQRLDQAIEADNALVSMMHDNLPSLQLLAGPAQSIRDQMPSLTDEDDGELQAARKARAELERILPKVQVLRRARKEALSNFKDTVRSADISGQLLTARDPRAVIDSTIAEHRKASQPIHDNLESQRKLMSAIVDAYASYGDIRSRHDQLAAERQEFIDSLSGSFDVFVAVRARVDKARRFYGAAEEELQRLQKEARPSRPPPQRPAAALPSKRSTGPSAPPADRSAAPPAGYDAGAMLQPTPVFQPSEASPQANGHDVRFRARNHANVKARPASMLAPGSSGNYHTQAGFQGSIQPSTIDLHPIGEALADAGAAHSYSAASEPSSAAPRRTLFKRSASKPNAVHLHRRLSVADPADAEEQAQQLAHRLRGDDDDDMTPSGMQSLSPLAELSPSDGSRPSGTHSGASVSHGRPTLLDAAVDSLRETILRLEKQQPSGENGFEKEFNLLRMDDLRYHDPSMCRIAAQNRDKNRYVDILPYDAFRVRLETDRETATQGNDYINACHVKNLLPTSPDFICAQGPTPTTTGDFWKMTFQQRSRLIVMVTNLVEGNRVKCDRYWPNKGETLSIPQTPQGDALDITYQDTHAVSDTMEIRRFLLTCWKNASTPIKRVVHQVHFVGWPDRGVPRDPSTFIQFLYRVQELHRRFMADSRKAGDPQSPIIVHCSAGVGRTGTFCLLYSVLALLPMLQQTPADSGTTGLGSSVLVRKIDVLDMVTRMRKARRHMVQTLAQYEFCYRCALELAEHYRRTHPGLSASPAKLMGHHNAQAENGDNLRKAAEEDHQAELRRQAELRLKFEQDEARRLQEQKLQEEIRKREDAWRRQQEEEARRRQQEEAWRRQQEEEARRLQQQAEEEARMRQQAEEEARRRQQEEAWRRQQEEEARRLQQQAEEEARMRQQAEEDARRRQQEEAWRRQQEEEARRLQQQAEEEARRRQQAEEEARMRQQQSAMLSSPFHHVGPQQITGSSAAETLPATSDTGRMPSRHSSTGTNPFDLGGVFGLPPQPDANDVFSPFMGKSQSTVPSNPFNQHHPSSFASSASSHFHMQSYQPALNPATAYGSQPSPHVPSVSQGPVSFVSAAPTFSGTPSDSASKSFQMPQAGMASGTMSHTPSSAQQPVNPFTNVHYSAPQHSHHHPPQPYRDQPNTFQQQPPNSLNHYTSGQSWVNQLSPQPGMQQPGAYGDLFRQQQQQQPVDVMSLFEGSSQAGDGGVLKPDQASNTGSLLD